MKLPCACSFISVFLFLLVSCGYGSPETLWKKEFATANLDKETVVFSIDKLSQGKHSIQFFLSPTDIESLRKSNTPIEFNFTVEMKQGKKLISKDFSFILIGADVGHGQHLYTIPKDFWYSNNGRIQITIKDIVYDSLFTQYYDKILFSLKRHSIFFR